MNRRQFIAWLSTLPAFFGMGCRACREDNQGRKLPPTVAPTKPALTTLSDSEAQTLGTVLERLLPHTEAPPSPGALDTNVLAYVDRQLGEEHFRALRELVTKGAVYLDAIARRLHRKRFHELGPSEQDAILADFQAGRVPGLRFAQTRFFEVVHALALEGFMGDPRHGGNRENLAWKWIGMSSACGHIQTGG